MADLTMAKRKKMSSSEFALPGKGEGSGGKGSGSYPIPDEAHGRLALAMVAKNGSPEEKAKVRAAVKRKFPNIEQGSGTLTPLGQRTLAGFQKKFGTDQGHAKFEQALRTGTIDRKKMEQS